MPERLDQHLFLFINSMNSPFWDQVMYIISGRVIWAPLYLAILITLGIRYRRKFLILILVIILAIILSDQISLLIKNSVHRLRPCHEPALEGLVHLVRNQCGGAYGFVSSHASNSFNIAVLSLLLIKRKWFSYSMLLWAAIIGYSRVYLGVHYPGDVLCGSLIGILIGWSLFRFYEYLDSRHLKKSEYFNRA
jgi:undecaprenyl-diphosphatase